MQRRTESNKPIIYEREMRDVPAQPNQTLLAVTLEAGIDIGHSCGGMGSCGTCHVFVLEGADQLPPREGVEAERASDLFFASNERLACQIPALSGLKVRIP